MTRARMASLEVRRIIEDCMMLNPVWPMPTRISMARESGKETERAKTSVATALSRELAVNTMPSR